MARELILIPKLKYEQLLKKSEKEPIQINKNDDRTDETKTTMNFNSEKPEKSFVEMKPQDFLQKRQRLKRVAVKNPDGASPFLQRQNMSKPITTKSQRVAGTTKQKWLTFNV